MYWFPSQHYVTSSGFLNLLMFYSLKYLSTLFHAEYVYRVPFPEQLKIYSYLYCITTAYPFMMLKKQICKTIRHPERYHLAITKTISSHLQGIEDIYKLNHDCKQCDL
jgi:hypothetical protein